MKQETNELAGAATETVRAHQVVAANRWDLLEVPELGAWTPTERVTAVIPYYQAPDELEITLAALSEQTYPSDLLQVVVVDDGSNPPLELPEGHRGLDLKVVHQEDRGFGAPRARNNGVREADGSIIVFLDCDMVPEPWQIEAHARWHHASDHAVSLGFRRHVEFDGISADEVAQAAKDGELAPLFDGRDQQVPEWIDYNMRRTDDLAGPYDDPFRIVTSGNLGVRKETFWAVGGFDESFTQWGGEDTELGFRLFIHGAVLAPDRQAPCWHQGHGHMPDESEQRSLEQQRAKMAHIMAHRGFRRNRPGRVYAIPRLAVEVQVDDVPGSLVLETVESVLASTFYDLRVYLRLREDHPSYVQLSRDLGGDPRVVVGDEPIERWMPHVLTLPAGATVKAETIKQLVDMMWRSETSLGVLRITVPHRRPGELTATLVRTRALGRARLVGAAEDEVVERAAELFGQRWLTGLDMGLVWAGKDDANAEADADSPHEGPGATEMAQLQDLWDAFGKMEPSQRRAVLAIARRVLGLDPRVRSALLSIASRLTGVFRLFASVASARPIAKVRSLLRSIKRRVKGLLGRSR